MLRGCFLIELVSASAEETVSIGRRIARSLAPGSVIALRGGLGSGKTCLAKGIALGLGVDEPLTSPTYTIISEYPIDSQHESRQTGGQPSALYHIDAYRLDNDEDFDNIGGRELISGNGVALVEWGDRVQKSLPDNAIVIALEITGPESRLIRINGLEKL